MKRHYLIIITAALALKAAYPLMTLLEWQVYPDVPSADKSLLEASYAINDAGWYMNIAENGYPEIGSRDDLGCCRANCFRQSSYAFFPLFPVLIAGADRLLPGDVLPAAVLLSSVISLLAFIAFYRFAAHWWQDAGKGLWSALLLLCMPFHYFFSMVYTESLFLLLLISAFAAVHSGRLFCAAVAFAGLVLCRPNGWVTGLPLLLFLYEQQRGGNFMSRPFVSREFLRSQWLWLPAAAVLAVYCTYLYYRTGDPLAFITAQKGWCKSWVFPLRSLFSTGETYHQVNSVYTVIFMTAALALLLWKRIPAGFHLLIWTGLLLPLAAGSIVSMPRYISLLFPLFLAGGFLHGKRWGTAAIISAVILQLVTYHFWVHSPNILGL